MLCPAIPSLALQKSGTAVDIKYNDKKKPTLDLQEPKTRGGLQISKVLPIILFACSNSVASAPQKHLGKKQPFLVVCK